MTRKYLFLIVICLPLINQAQNILPVFKSKPVYNQKKERKISKNEKEIVRLFTERMNLNPLLFNKEKLEEEKNALTSKIDSLLHENESLKHLADSISRYSLVTFYGSAAIGAGTDFLSTITSTGQLSAIVNPFGNTFVGIGANLLFANPDKGISRDSVDFKSLMFPETGRFGVLASVSQKFHLNKKNNPDVDNEFRQHFLVPQFSFAYRRVAIDTVATGFKVLNYNIGLKYQLEGITKDSDRITFSIMPYYHFFNIPNEDVNHFHKYVNDSLFANNNKGAAIQGLGIKTTLQYNSLLFFFDIRRNIHTTDNMIDGNPFKGTLVNVGFSTNIQLTLKKKKKEDDN